MSLRHSSRCQLTGSDSSTRSAPLEAFMRGRAGATENFREFTFKINRPLHCGPHDEVMHLNMHALLNEEGEKEHKNEFCNRLSATANELDSNMHLLTTSYKWG